MSDELDPDLATVIELEQRLLEPQVRHDPAALAELLHESFREFGASGRVYDRASIIDALVASDGRTGEAVDFQAVRLSPDVVLLTYRTDTPSLRTSIWTRDLAGVWRIRHHQGTPASS